MRKSMQSVGFLLATKPNHWAKYIQWFKAKLRTLNDADVIVLPPNGAAGDRNTILDNARYLANHFDVIVTAGTQAALACKEATQTNRKPFVFASVGDAAISGLTPHHGGNFTGGCNGQVKYVSKRVDHMLNNSIFKEPFAVVGNSTNEPAKTAMAAAASALDDKHKQYRLASITPDDDIGRFIDGLKAQGIKSLYVCSDLWITVHSTDLNNKAHAAGMKTMWEFQEHKTVHNGDDYYGVNFKDMFEKAAEYVNKILRDTDTKAGDLPLYEPSPSAKKRKSRASLGKKRPASVTKKKVRRGR